jgi:hypothetical protein
VPILHVSVDLLVAPSFCAERKLKFEICGFTITFDGKELCIKFGIFTIRCMSGELTGPIFL